MILYHGSNQDFTAVDLSKSKDRRDFGKGFYTTTIREQALQWGYNMYQRFGGEGIYLYEFAFSPVPELKSKQFPGISDDWFDFILSNRTSNGLSHDFDFVQGPVADDKTVLTITGFIDGLYSREEAMQRLRYSKANDQVSLHTEKAVSLLSLQGKRRTPHNKILYNGQDITFFLAQKVEHIVSILAERNKSSFDSAYNNFLHSQTYQSLQNTTTMLWTESAEFIADEYFREQTKQ
ncbi:MAG: DUF3990 domain-containing protein [Spirochaetaceae bacterium]|jgi:hypothetical protein|nr:DUF3990 domain-containing protein [Spirochaetaceae bacterium]